MITLNSVFCSEMILQANKPVRVFGEGEGTVTVCFDGVEKQVEAKGSWLVEFAPIDYGGPHKMTVEGDGISRTLDGLYGGDVYLISGQSNMQMKLGETNEPVERYEENANVRFFTVNRLEDQEHYHEGDGWVALTKENAARFSALGYYVAKSLSQNDRKIGMIACYQGASIIQTWLPESVANREEFLSEEPVKERKDYPLWNRNGVLYEHQLKKILPLSVSGVIWYQGESNTHGDEGYCYFEMLKALIISWRGAFCDPELPFFVVQIADLRGRGDGWRRVQNAQMKAGDELSGVTCIVSRDICEDDNIHPPTKRLLGERIAEKILSAK